MAWPKQIKMKAKKEIYETDISNLNILFDFSKSKIFK